MKRYRILFNPHAGNGRGEEESKALEQILTDGTICFQDMTKIGSYEDFFASFDENDTLIIAGGDGTLNRFINDTDGLSLPEDVYYYAVGSGNDFWHDLGYRKGDRPAKINRYLKDLPRIEVNGRQQRVLNGIGYGIDGYCCEEGDRLRKNSVKEINYTSIAIKGLHFHYRPTAATVTVDGKEYRFDRVWLAPTMNGRFYGGGMMPTPSQNRLDPERKVSLMVMGGSGKLKTLMIFPSIFQGKHIKREKYVHVFSGNDITVTFDRPTPLQIDGETVSGVKSYRIFSSAVPEKKEQAELADA